MAAERLPATSVPVRATDEWGCDTSDVVMFHRFLRMMFADAATIIERVPNGDRRGTARAARHLREVMHALHAHHHGEDVVLWDALETRAPSCAVHVGQMRVQHEEIARLLDELGADVDRWHATARADHASAVQTSLSTLTTALDRHLAQEEVRILPTAEISFTQREWGRLEQHGRRSVPPRWLFMQLGFMLESMSPAEQAAFLRALPAPARILWSAVGRRSFTRRRRALMGSAVSPSNGKSTP